MARPRKLIRQLVPSYLAIAILSLAGVEWYTLTSLEDFYFERTVRELEDTARLVGRIVAGQGDVVEQGSLQALASELEQETGVRITLITREGRVEADSRRDPTSMDDHGNRPEVLEALTEGTGQSRRYSKTLGEDSMYLALAEPGGSDSLIVRTCKPMTEAAAEIRRVQHSIVFAGLLAVLGVLAMSLLMARRIGRPIQRITEVAEYYADGDFTRRFEVQDYEEMQALADAMHRMAALLDERFRTITRQHTELEGILASMAEAVVVLDAVGKVLRINRAAGVLLGVDLESVRGRTLDDIVGPRELAALLREILASEDDLAERDLVLRVPEELHLLLQGSPLLDETGNRVGAVVVISDLTHLRRLENIRADFVSNVSHELKTPLTSLKGFVETLRDGAVDDPAHAQRFLDIIGRQTDRLAEIVEDLLSLSRLEDEVARDAIDLVRQPLAPVLRSAVLACQPQVREREGEVELSCPADLQAEIAAPLLELALVNLVDNALKYGGESPLVRVSAALEEGEVVIRVRDQGVGIPRSDQPRVFERFYRVDKGRSRRDGGTGLGLAIVKHITRAHLGRVRVRSEPGKGSTFILHLPASS